MCFEPVEAFEYVVGRAGGDDAARSHDVHGVGQVGHEVQVVLDDEQGRAVRGQRPQHAGQRRHFARVQPRRGLVEEQDARASRQGPREFDPPQGSGRQARRRERPYGSVEPEQPQHPFHGVRVHDSALLGAHAYVLGHRQGREDGELLKGAGDTEPGPRVGGQPGDVPLPEPDPPGIRPHGPGETVEQGALPGPVGPDDGGDPARGQSRSTPSRAVNPS